MMRLSHHPTVTGGTTHGWLTVHRATVPPNGVPGFHEPDTRRVSATGLALRGRIPRPDGGVAYGWETADCAPVYRLQKLSAPDTGRSAVVHPHRPQNLCPPGGARALIRDGSGESQPVDSCPPPCAAHGPAHSRWCPRPFAGRTGAAARRLRGRRGHRRHTAGGGTNTRRRRPSRSTGLPPFTLDGTERRIVRPQDPVE